MLSTAWLSINRIRLEFKRNNGLEHSDVLCSVLIESDWNLKLFDIFCIPAEHLVLIESDWNLKTGIQERCEQDCKGINRIRLEFKRSSKRSLQRRTGVLIESDWNLKLF